MQRAADDVRISDWSSAVCSSDLVDVAALLPHSCVRVFVMGQRGADREVATADDLVEMKGIKEEAMRAGAVGVGTSRSLFHKRSEGAFTTTAERRVGKEDVRTCRNQGRRCRVKKKKVTDSR